MKIPLFIAREPGNKCGECPFLKADYFSRSADCVLFDSRLRPNLDYGCVDSWETCSQCDTFAQRANES